MQRQQERPPPRRRVPKNQLDSAGWIDFATVSWPRSLLSFAQDHDLTEDDMEEWGISWKDRADYCYARFRQNWASLQQHNRLVLPTGRLWFLRSPSNIAFFRGLAGYFFLATACFAINHIFYIATPFVLKQALDVRHSGASAGCPPANRSSDPLVPHCRRSPWPRIRLVFTASFGWLRWRLAAWFHRCSWVHQCCPSRC